jgi:predicted amidohydrolase
MKVALLQSNPGADREANLLMAGDRVRKAAAAGAHVVVLPEMFGFMGPETNRRRLATSLAAGDFQWLASVARQCKVFLIGGSAPEIPTSGQGETFHQGKVWNTHQSFSPEGTVLYTYRKTHLFNLRSASGNTEFRESDWYNPGKVPEQGFRIESDTSVWHALTLICYDLRFPEIFRLPAFLNDPIDVVFLPAAFTYRTGQAHWEVLLRARAIENQCYVVACNQTGYFKGSAAGQAKRNFGHSMVVSPWGEVVAAAGEEEGLLFAELSLEEVSRVRTMLPALQNRRIGCNGD